MKYIKSIHEGFSDPGESYQPSPQRYADMPAKSMLFNCMYIGPEDALLVKKGVPNELWLLKLETVEDIEEFRDHVVYYEISDRVREWEPIDDEAVEGFSTLVYNGWFVKEPRKPQTPDLPVLYKPESLCEDPNEALDEYIWGDAILIRVSGALAAHLKEEYLKAMTGATLPTKMEKNLRQGINLLSKVYPEGRLLPGEEPEA